MRIYVGRQDGLNCANWSPTDHSDGIEVAKDEASLGLEESYCTAKGMEEKRTGRWDLGWAEWVWDGMRPSL